MASDGSIKITTELDSKAAEKALSKFSDVAKTGLKGITVAVGAVSTALAGASGYAISTGIDFESAFAGVKKTVDATDTELDEFRQGIRDMAKEMPQSASQIAEVAEAAGQLGIENKNLLSFTEVMSNLGVATNMSATEAATSLARLANITQMPQENFDRLGSTIVALGNNLATTESEITEMGLRLSGAGKQVGMSEDQILGLAGAISSVGIEADAGGSAVSTVMTKMQLAVEQGGESLEQFADVAGMSASEFQQAFKEDAAQALVSFVEGLGTMDERGKSAIATLSDMEITEIRQRDALLRLAGAGDVLSESLGIASQAWAENTALTKEAEQRYETLESRIQILKNNVSDLGITFYDSIRDPLKATVDAGIGYIDELSAAFQSEGLSGAVSAAGDIFADVAVEAASHAPDMVSSAAQFIQSFAYGIYENRGQLISAAGSIATALGEGLADLLPASVSGPVKAAVDEIGESFENGGLRTAISTVSTAFENFSKIVGKVAKVTLPPLTKALDLAAENLDLVAATTTAAFTAFKGYKVITSASKAAKALTATTKMLSAAEKANALQVLAASGALTAKEMIVGVLTGKIRLATAAQAAWNAIMNANPIGLLVTAIGALAAGIGVYTLTQKEAETATDKANKKLAEQVTAIRETQAARQEEVAGIQTEYGHYQQLWNELQGIVDQNGKVKAGYEERAAFITSTLSEALGVEIEMTDGTIQKYSELSQSIDQIIQKKKAEALMNAYEDDYTEAIKNQNEAAKELSRTYDDYSAAKERAKEASEALKAAEESMTEEQAAGSFEIMQLQQAQMDANAELEKAEKAYNNAKTASEEYSSTISNYESAMGAVESGSADASAAVLALSNDLLKAGSANEESLKNQVDTMRTSYDEMQEAAAEKGSGVTTEMVNQARAMWLMAQIEYEKGTTNNKALIQQWEAEINSLLSNSGGPEAAAQEGAETGAGYASGIESQTDEAYSSGEALATNANDGASSKTGYDAGYGFGSGFVLGINDWVGSAIAAGAKLGAEALEAAKTEIDSHSPSKETMKLGKYFGQGFEIGISKEEDSVRKASKRLGDASLSALDPDAIVDQIKALDIANVLDQIDFAMTDMNFRIADRVTAKMEVADRSAASSNLICTLSDADIEKLASRIGSVTANEVSKKLDNRPIYLDTNRIDKPLPKGAVPRI